MSAAMNEKERREAISAGERALQSLHEARDALKSARNWGIFDIVGGGFFSTLIKHGHMDDARAAMERAQQDLRIFSRELGDVHIQLDTGDFLTFADFFFDGFIADMMVQSRIAEAQSQVEDVAAKVEALLAYLYTHE